jgi:hypothetical protein
MTIEMSRGLRVLIAVALTLSVTSSAFAACLPGEPAASTEMACCETGHHDCGQSMRAADCCASTTVSAGKFIAAAPSTPARPVLVCALSHGIVPIVSLMHQPVAWRSEPVPSASPPVYLRISSLRI